MTAFQTQFQDEPRSRPPQDLPPPEDAADTPGGPVGSLAGAAQGRADTSTRRARRQRAGSSPLAQVLAPARAGVVVAFVCGLAGAALQLLPAVTLTWLAEEATGQALTAASAWRYVVLAVVGLTLGHVFYLWGTGYAHKVEASFRHDLRRRLSRHLARLPLGWHTEETSGRVRSVLTDDIAKIHPIIAHLGADLGMSVGAPLLGLAYLASRSWQMTVVLLAWLLVLVLVLGGLTMATGRDSIQVFSQAQKDLSTATVEMVDGIATVKAFGMGDTLFSRFSTALDHYTKASYNFMRGPGVPMAVLSAAVSPAGMLVPIMAGGWWLASRGAMEPVGIIPFVLVGVGLPAGVSSISSMAHLLAQGREAAASVQALLEEDQLPEPAVPLALARGHVTRPAREVVAAGQPAAVAGDDDGHGTSVRAEAGIEVELDGVSFRYREDLPWVLHDVSLRLEPGTVTAVVGPSGSGKSTLVRLVARFWDVDRGAVRVGGVDVRHVSSTELLAQMTVMLQEGGLLADTVAANIRLARPEATIERVRQAARAARVHERVMTLPQGYDTVLGQEGGHLSGGEAQRLALARAFLADAPLLLLDEATAQADPRSERQIQEGLAHLAAGRTVLVIAHRLATVVGADQILVLDHGRLVESGSHEELLAAGGTYATMWEAQQ